LRNAIILGFRVVMCCHIDAVNDVLQVD